MSAYALVHSFDTVSPPLKTSEIIGFVLQHPIETALGAIWAFFLPLGILRWKGIVVASVYAGWLSIILKGRRESEIWVEVAYNRNMIIAGLLAIRGFSYRAFPHNVEFLVPGQSQSLFKSSSAEFWVESLVYKSAFCVTAISEFDAAVIRCLGVQRVDVMKYGPIGDDYKTLKIIRKERLRNEHHGYLMLGTASNPPTLEGISKLLAEIREGQLEEDFYLAGFGTEVFMRDAPSNVVVLGGVTPEQLSELMTRCKGIVICHRQSSGLLTRIREAVLAGIPVWLLGEYIQSHEFDGCKVKTIYRLQDLP